MRARHLNFPSPKQPGCQLSLSIVMSTSHNTLSLLETTGLQANAMVSQLNEIFPPINPKPSDTMEKIMYRSGQRSVVEWIIKYMEAT